jgi:membrane-bound lytic murein transglycosylase D
MAMAAYNCGVGCIRKAVRRGGTYDFWRLSRRGLLPDETVNYVPKFQAAMTIAREPQRFGFRPKRSYEFPVVKRVRVPGRVRVSEIARKHRVSIESLISLNPNLLAGQTPNSRRGYEVWIPLAK